MKYKYIMCFFSVSLVACVVIRTLQLLFTIDGQTGFIKTEYRSLSVGMMALLCLAAVVCIIIGTAVRRCPMKMPKVSPILGIGSLLLGTSILYEVFSIFSLSRVHIYQVIALEAFGCFTGLFFIAFGIKAFVKYEFPKVLFIIPVIYWTVKLVYVFSSISSLVLITDNILNCTAYCATLVFMFEFAKLANNINIERTSRTLLASGLCAANLSIVSSLPRFILALSGRANLLHENASSITMLITGVFIALFIKYYFCNGNLSHRHRKHSKNSNRFLPEDHNQCNFYMGNKRRSSK